MVVVMVVLRRHLLQVWRGVRRQLQVGQDAPARGLDAQVLPVDPGQPGGQVGRVPLLAALGSNLAPEASIDVSQGLHLVRVVKDLSEQRDVGDGQPEGVDLGKSLFVRKGRDVNPQLFESGVDAGRAVRKKIKNFNRLREIFLKYFIIVNLTNFYHSLESLYYNFNYSSKIT